MEGVSSLLDGRVALVTGAGAGIGKGIALGLSRFGADVAAVDMNETTAQRTAADIVVQGRRALAIRADVRKEEEVQSMVDMALRTFSQIHILVNNVGGTFRAPFLETTEKGWEALLRLNLTSVFYCTRRVAEVMIRQQKGGSIINIISIEAVRAAPLFAPYAASKAAVRSLTQSLALELAPHGIRINAIAPDVVLTEGVRALMPAGTEEEFRHTIPLGRAGMPEDIAGAAVFLASDLSGFITGETLHVDGGAHAAAGWCYYPEAGWVRHQPAASGKVRPEAR